MKTFDYVIGNNIYDLQRALNDAEELSNEFGKTNVEVNIFKADNFFYAVFKRVRIRREETNE